MNKILKTIVIILILIPVLATGSNLIEEEKFVKKFADEAITILNNKQLEKSEKNDQITNLVMSAIDLNLISQFYRNIALKEYNLDRDN